MARLIDLDQLREKIDALWTEYGRITGAEFVRLDDVKRAIEEMDVVEQDDWIPIHGDEAELPDVDSDGDSELIMLSFANCSVPCIGRYRVDDEGGAFYEGDEDEPLSKIGLFVNAWRYLPEAYEEDE